MSSSGRHPWDANDPYPEPYPYQWGHPHFDGAAAHEAHTAALEKSMTFQEYLERSEQAGAIDFALRIARTPDGKLDFYIRPQGRDGETGDFTVSGAFVTKLDVGAGSKRDHGAPLVGSGK